MEKKGLIKEGLTLYGLRHTIATELRQEGFDFLTIADYLGQATVEMAQWYSRDADLKKRMFEVGEHMDIALKDVGRGVKLW